jgi:hypothetical protein
MKIGFLGSLAAVLAGTGVALAQAPAPSAPATGSPPAAAAQETLTTAPTPAPTAGNPAHAGVLAPSHLGGDGECCHPTVADCDDAYRHYRGWAAVEYLLWDIKDQNVPGIASLNRIPITLPVVGPVTAIFQSTPILPGGSTLTDHERSGVRLSGGFWFDDDHCWGVEASYFQLQQQRTTSIVGPQMTSLDINTPILVQVGTTAGTTSTITDSTGFTSTITTSQIVTQPLALHGTLAASTLASGANRVWGAEINGCCTTCYFGAVAFDFLLGFRYIDLSEDLLILNNVALNAPPLAVTMSTSDAFATRNQIYAPQVGAGFTGYWGPISLEGQAKIGLGGVHQGVSLFGTGTPTGGLLIQKVDAGDHTRDRYASVSEVTLNAGYQFTRNIRGFVGYNLTYIVNVLRPGDQLSPAVNNTQVLISGQPTVLSMRQLDFRFNDRDIWLTGVNFGLEFRY